MFRLLFFIGLLTVSGPFTHAQHLLSGWQQDAFIHIGGMFAHDALSEEPAMRARLWAHSVELAQAIDSLQQLVAKVNLALRQQPTPQLLEERQNYQWMISNCRQMLRTNERLLRGQASLLCIIEE